MLLQASERLQEKDRAGDKLVNALGGGGVSLRGARGPNFGLNLQDVLVKKKRKRLVKRRSLTC